jgi:hypothetical protein
MTMVISDERDSDGNWVRSKQTSDGRKYTKAWVYFSGMRNRCKKNGAVQKARTTYQGCINGFSSFQDFAEWATKQPGYGLNGWCLDKDLIFKGNKKYSEENCVFIPKEMNNALTNRARYRGKLPVGVSIDSRTGTTFRASIADQGKDVRIGAFATIEEAFEKYRAHKEKKLISLAMKYAGQIDQRAFNALVHYKIEITD